MRVWLKAFGIFALMVAVPFAIHAMLGRNPRFTGELSFGDFAWSDALNYVAYGAVAIAVLAGVIALSVAIYEAREVSEYLTLAERELNNLLRAWGGGWSKEARQEAAKERGLWLQMIKDDKAEVHKEFFALNQEDLKGGGPQGAAMGKARMTAFLLRELYDANVETAQGKIVAEVKNNDGKIPFVAPGIRELLDLEHFDKDKGFPHGSGVNWFHLWLAVKLHGHPRAIIMVRADKTVATDGDVIKELTTAKV